MEQLEDSRHILMAQLQDFSHVRLQLHVPSQERKILRQNDTHPNQNIMKILSLKNMLFVPT